MDALIEAKREVLRKLVDAYCCMKDLYYREDMLVETSPECLSMMEHEINKMCKELVGA